MQSQEIKDLAAALVKAQANLKPASKDGTNPHFRSSYATLQSVWDAARLVLSPNGLSIVQSFEAGDGDTVSVTTTLLHTSGQFIGGTLTLKPTKADPQGLGSAITYARRYALSAILGIVADDDDDGNAASAPKPVEAYKPKGPLASTETVAALNAQCADAKKADKLQKALDAKDILTFSDLSEEDAKKLLTWITK
jgi:hypothetical protein